MKHEPDFEKYLNEVIDAVYQQAARDWTWSELAAKAGLSQSCVYRLGTYQTKSPHLRTVYRLCKAVGIEIPSITSVKQLRRRLRKAG